MTLATPTIPATPATQPRLTPADHGRQVSLAEFENLETTEDGPYELSRGTIIVSGVPNPGHGDYVERLIRALVAYEITTPGAPPFSFRGGSDSKLLIWQLESERHADLVIYKTQRAAEDSTAWRTWIPEIVVEVVSPSSVERDYILKAEEYLELGAAEYWIIDPKRRTLTYHVRANDQWAISTLSGDAILVTPQLPGFQLPISKIFT